MKKEFAGMKKNRILAFIFKPILLWFIAGVIDFSLVHHYKKPLFSICTESMQGGGSGTYVGLGYSFDIEGNFTPDTSDYGVTSYRCYILGKQVSRGFWEKMLVSENYYFSKMNFNVAFANWTDDSHFYAASLNSDKYIESSKLHLPVFLFSSLDELNNFKQTYENVLSMNQSWDEVSSFEEITEEIDEDFFDDQSLGLIYVSANNCTHRFAVSDVYVEDDTINFEVKETTRAETVDTAMAGWFITAEIPNDLLFDEAKIDAFMK